MRQRIGNFFAEAHGRPLRHYDWIAPLDAPENAHEIQAQIKPALYLVPEDGVQHGFVQTYRYARGVHVHIVLYEDCHRRECPGHNTTRGLAPRFTRHVRIVTPEPETLEWAKALVGEHATLLLGRTRVGDLSALAALGAVDEARAVARAIVADATATYEELAAVWQLVPLRLRIGAVARTLARRAGWRA